MSEKIVFIGNSIVNGFPMSRGRSFPGLVRAAIKAGESSFHADVINKGVNGETTADILLRFDHDVLDHSPRVVFIMTGTNDFIYREADPAACMENLQEMARRSKAAGICPVFMTPIHVHEEKASRMWMAGVGVDYGKVNREVDAFGDLIRESGEMVLDACAAWDEEMAARSEEMAAGEGLPLRENAYLDGVHPTPEGYAFLAKTVLAWLEEHAGELGLKQ